MLWFCHKFKQCKFFIGYDVMKQSILADNLFSSVLLSTNYKYVEFAVGQLNHYQISHYILPNLESYIV